MLQYINDGGEMAVSRVTADGSQELSLQSSEVNKHKLVACQ